MYFLYPETCGVRLEDMDAIFGDASVAIGTPAMRGEAGSLMGPGSPTESGDGPARPILGPSSAIPGLSLDPPDFDGDRNGKPPSQTSRSFSGGVGGWISRIVAQPGGRNGKSGGGNSYAALRQGEE